MPELRKDPVVGRWVIIATERAHRPNDFLTLPRDHGGGFCPFCPTNEDQTPEEVLAYRPDGSRPNTPGWKLRVVPNKYPALKIEGGLNREGFGLYDKMNGIGAHEVVIETPDHQRTLFELTDKEIEEILWAYRDRMMDLKKDPRFRYVVIFKNSGRLAGATLEHSHSQLVALPIIPRNISNEMRGAKEYYGYKERCIYCDIIRQEQADGRRVVYENPDLLVVQPWAPRFPFETWILPKQHASAFEDAQKHEYQNLANALRVTLRKLAVALDRPSYNLIVHTSPFLERQNPYYHWHIEIIPKLSAVTGFDSGSGFYINPTPPEEAAGALRDVTG